jgi:hypothetical protein
VQADLNEEARLPYEQLGSRQSEVHFGLARLTRDASAGLDTQTETVSAFIAYSRGVSRRLELGVLLPYVLYAEQTAQNAAGRTKRAEGRYGVGDPTLRVRYALKGEGNNVALSVGALATPDWGGRARGFAGHADTLEPFLVLGRAIGATQLYLRYGYAWRSGDTPDAQRVTLGGRRPLGDGWGALATLSYVRSMGSGNVEAHGVPGGSLGGFANLPNGMQLVGWYGVSGYSQQASSGRVDDTRTRQLVLSLVHRF